MPLSLCRLPKCRILLDLMEAQGVDVAAVWGHGSSVAGHALCSDDMRGVLTEPSICSDDIKGSLADFALSSDESSDNINPLPDRNSDMSLCSDESDRSLADIALCADESNDSGLLPAPITSA